MWRRRLRRVLLGLLAATLALAVLYVAVRPFRIAILTLALVPELLEDAPRPLSALTPEPARFSVTYGEVRTDRMDVYVPASSPVDLATPDRYPALLFVLGVNPLPLDDERVVRTATALARLGLVVAAPESAEMRDRRLTPDERDHLISAFEAVAAMGEVDPERIGMAGFSAGAGVALLAAADPRIADRVAFVNSFGGFGDAGSLLVEVATRSMVVDGESRQWQPNTLAREVFLRLLLDTVPDADDREVLRAEIEGLVLADGPTSRSYDPVVAERLDGDARAAYRLATAADRAVAVAALASFSDAFRRDLAALSPVLAAGGLRAPIYLMHDVADPAIPFSQFGRLVDAIPAERISRASEFAFFDHVSPGALEPGAIPHLWGFFQHLSAVASEAFSTE